MKVRVLIDMDYGASGIRRSVNALDSAMRDYNEKLRHADPSAEIDFEVLGIDRSAAPGENREEQKPMKVKATYRIVFEVTRETEIDDDSYAALEEHERIRDRDASPERLMPLWLESHLHESDAEVFRDWRTDRPLPADFEFQYAGVAEAAAAEQGEAVDHG